MADNDVKLVADAICSIPRCVDSHEDVARAVLGALAGAERLRADDSGVEVQLRATLRRMWRDSGDPRTGYQAGYVHAIRDLAHEMGVDLDG